MTHNTDQWDAYPDDPGGTPQAPTQFVLTFNATGVVGQGEAPDPPVRHTAAADDNKE